MYRSKNHVYALSSPSVADLHGSGVGSVPSSQVSDWAAHRSALSQAVASGRSARRQGQVTDTVRPTVPRTA